MTKYSLSEIMTNAHAIRRNLNVSMSEALRKAWAAAKLPKFVDQKATLTAAFKAKYPTGTIQIHQFWMGAKVQFTANGKAYNYIGHDWQKRLGISVA